MGGSDDVDYLTLEMSITGSISFFASLFVLVTWMVFKELHSKQYIQHIVCVEFCCLMQSIAVLLGPHQSTGSPRCWFQGMVLVMFPLSSVLWILVISYQLYAVVMTGKVFSGAHALHRQLVCWLFPLCATLLPLTTNTYGQISGQVDVCTVANRSDSPKWGKTFWGIASFYGWLWLGILLIIMGFVRIMLRVRQQALPAVIRGSILVLGCYPLILVLCWIFPTFSRIYFDLPQNGQQGDDDNGQMYPGEGVIAVLANVMPNLQGFFVALALVITSDEVRRRWYVTFARLFGWEGDDRESFLSSAHDSTKIPTTQKAHGAPGVEGGASGGSLPTEAAEQEETRFSRLSRFFVPTFGPAKGSEGARNSSVDGFGYGNARFSLSNALRFSSAAASSNRFSSGEEAKQRSDSQIDMRTFRSSAATAASTETDEMSGAETGNAGGTRAASGSGSGSGSGSVTHSPMYPAHGHGPAGATAATGSSGEGAGAHVRNVPLGAAAMSAGSMEDNNAL